MNILIITPFYKHDRNIASVRWTNIGTRLAKKHNVIVVTQPHDDMDTNISIEKKEDGILVARINQKTNYEKIAIKHFGGETGDDWQAKSYLDKPEQPRDDLKRKVKNRLLYNSMKSKAKLYAKYILSNVIPKDTRIDVVISSACPFIEMLFGYEIKKELSCKWICDFRDLPFHEDVCDSTHLQKRIMEKVLPKADIITVVIERMKEYLVDSFKVLQDSRIEIVTNGFSLDDYVESHDLQVNNSLKLVYTGSLSWDNSMDMLFDAIQRAKKHNKDFNATVECAGGNNQGILRDAGHFGMENIVKDYGFVTRKDALRLQNSADILFLSVRNLPGRGFAAKLFEYLLNKKPIICLIIYKYKKCDAEKFVESLNLGIVGNEIDYEGSVKKIAEYLLMQFKRKEDCKPLLYEPNLERLNEYNHDSITKRLEAICEEIIS